jgi:hypothetical protein
VFPLPAMRRETDTRIYSPDPRIQGSAIMLTKDGVFLTAKHVVEGYRPEQFSLIAYALNSSRGFCQLCEVKDLSLHPVLDVAIGICGTLPDNGFPYVLGLGTSPLGLGSSVFGIGFPETGVRTAGQEVLEFPPRFSDKLALLSVRREVAGGLT